MNILLATPMADGQTGVYLHDAIVREGHNVAFFDWREFTEKHGVRKMNEELVAAVRKLKPDVTIIIKGLGIAPGTIKLMREEHDHKIFGWIFDVTLGGTYVKDVPEYIKLIKEFDKFFTIDNDAIPELQKLGVNAALLPEGCHSPEHDEVPFNYIQAKKYGADIVFIGSTGGVHTIRDKFLKRIYDEGFNMKLYGEVYYPEGQEPDWVKDTHTGYAVMNDYHSIVVNSSKIVIGLDGWPHRSLSYSARLYRTLCAGGFYLMLHTKDVEKHFTPGVHLDTFKDPDEMIQKISKYLNDDELRQSIGINGQRLVKEQHTFELRIREMLSQV